MPIDPNALSDNELDNLIANYGRRGVHDAIYISALSIKAKRKGKGLDFEKTMNAIGEAASKGRFIGYGELAEASGADWTKVRYAIGPHLDDLVEYCHRRGWPLLSAIVVNKPNVKTGELEADSLKGFVAGARSAGIPVTDDYAFLRGQQSKVFEWAGSARD